MTDYQQGRTSGVFSAGSKVEDLCETFDREAQNLDAMKLAFGLAGKTLENYRDSMLKELSDAKIPIKEAEYGKVYVNRCVDLMRQLFNDTEAKRLQACGGSAAMKQATASIKKLYDDERSKLAAQEAWENDPDKDSKPRPVGMEPNQPLDLYKKESEVVVSELVDKKYRPRTKRK